MKVIFILLPRAGEGSLAMTRCREAGCSVHAVEYHTPMRQVEAIELVTYS